MGFTTIPKIEVYGGGSIRTGDITYTGNTAGQYSFGFSSGSFPATLSFSAVGVNMIPARNQAKAQANSTGSEAFVAAYTLMNGTQIGVKMYPSSNSGYLMFHRDGYSDSSFGSCNMDMTTCMSCFGNFTEDIDGNNRTIGIGRILTEPSGTYVGAIRFNDYDYNTYISGGVVPAPLYEWTAWDQIAGNNGRYRCNLTMVNDGTVEDIGVSIQRGREYFSRITTASSIYSIIQNAALGEERVIAYSGAARLSLTVNAGTQNVSRQLVYKFYLDQISETTPFYTATQIIYLTGNSPTADVLLSFVYDPGNTVAAFLPIEKVYYQDSEQFIFGGISPTDDELLYMLYWLNESQRGDYPYDTGTDDNGGNPSGPQPGDHIDAPSVPTLGGMSTGMFTVYCPNDTQLVQIAQFLWSDNVLDNIKKYFNNFADNIIALYVLPCKPGTLPFKNFKVGNMESDTITSVEYLTQRFAQIDMGSVYIKNTFDSYLDYSPFTKFEIYLPGVGMQTLSADDIMCPTDPDTGELIENTEGSVISVKYNIDLMTGILVALVMINGELRYQFPGKIGYTIPLTGENYSNIARGFVTAASGLIGAVATGGLSAPLTAGGVSAAVSGTVNAMKPEIHRGGNLTGDASMLGEKSPYLVYHRPNKPLLKNQERYTGFPSYKSGALSEFSGLTQVIDAHIEGISCTEAERAEILNLLKGGVIL